MHNEFTAVFERDGDWYIAYSPEIPGANGQGRTKDEARQSLAAAIALILEDRREDGYPVSPDTIPPTQAWRNSIVAKIVAANGNAIDEGDTVHAQWPIS
jgi:predicted RNase H-like HicB family nuclease